MKTSYLKLVLALIFLNILVIDTLAQAVVKVDGAWIQVTPQKNVFNILKGTQDLESKYGPDATDLASALDALEPLIPEQNIWNRYIGGENVDCGTSSAAVVSTLADILPDRGWNVNQMWSVDGTVPASKVWDFFSGENVAETATGHAVTMLTSPNGKQLIVDIYTGSMEIFEVKGVEGSNQVVGIEPSLLDAYYSTIGNSSKKFRPALTDHHAEATCPVPEEGEESETEVLNSWDPNDKLGVNGVSSARYIVNAAPLEYVIRFENVDTASAPAQEVIIIDSLNTSLYNLDTFTLGSAFFGLNQIEVPTGLQNYTTIIDMRPGKNFLVHFHASLDIETGRAFWKYTTLDPETMEIPVDPLEGFLPPNTDPPNGDGGVSFSVRLKENLPTGTVVDNWARIIFDLNEPIDTPSWINTIDESLPSSSVSGDYAMTPDSLITIRWSGSDMGSGIKNYDIFASIDGDQFMPIFTNHSDSTFSFRARSGHTYEFYSLAKDRVGNIESAKIVPDLSIGIDVSIEDPEPDIPFSYQLAQNYPNPFNPTTNIRFALPESASVSLVVYDILGRRVATLVNEEKVAGWHEVVWNTRGMASGTYFYRITAGNFTSTRKMMLLK